jgi:hypothetical protein
MNGVHAVTDVMFVMFKRVSIEGQQPGVSRCVCIGQDETDTESQPAAAPRMFTSSGGVNHRISCWHHTTADSIACFALADSAQLSIATTIASETLVHSQSRTKGIHSDLHPVAPE